jgi:hypothetical protein
MPTLISVDEFRDRFDISGDIEDKRLVPHVGSASRRLRKWVGDETYLRAINATTEFQDLQDDLKNAEAHLTYHFAIAGLNAPLTPKGVVKTTQAGEGKAMNVYLSPEQTQTLAMQMLEIAREICEPYLADQIATVEVVTCE